MFGTELFGSKIALPAGVCALNRELFNAFNQYGGFNPEKFNSRPLLKHFKPEALLPFTHTIRPSYSYLLNLLGLVLAANGVTAYSAVVTGSDTAPIGALIKPRRFSAIDWELDLMHPVLVAEPGFVLDSMLVSGCLPMDSYLTTAFKTPEYCAVVEGGLLADEEVRLHLN